jgi:hypothetical protein
VLEVQVLQTQEVQEPMVAIRLSLFLAQPLLPMAVEVGLTPAMRTQPLDLEVVAAVAQALRTTSQVTVRLDKALEADQV